MVAMRRVDRRSSSLTWPPNEISADSRSSDGLVIICPEPSLRLRSMDTVPAGAVRRSEGGEVPMELTLVRATNRRFQMWIPLLLAFGFVLVAAVPLAAGGGDQPVVASMLVSRTQASPGDNVTFWIWITPLKEKARNLIVTESNLDGFAVVSSEAPGSCLQTQLTWVCVQDELRPFAIAVHVVPGSGTEGKDLVNEAGVHQPGVRVSLAHGGGRSAHLDPRLRAGRIDGAALQRDGAVLESIGSCRTGGRRDLPSRGRRSRPRRDETLFVQPASPPVRPARLAAPGRDGPGGPGVRGTLPLPPAGPDRLRPVENPGRGGSLPAAPKRDPPEALLLRSHPRHGFRYPRWDARRGPHVRRGLHASLCGTLAGDPVPRREHRLRDRKECGRRRPQRPGQPHPFHPPGKGDPPGVREAKRRCAHELRRRRGALGRGRRPAGPDRLVMGASPTRETEHDRGMSPGSNSACHGQATAHSTP